ncbi:bestrophin-like domain [Streptomyces sp. 900105245]
MEWKQMGNGNPPIATSPSVEKMFAAVRSNPPNNPQDRPAYERILTDLSTVIANRRDRIENSEENMPALLQFFIFGGAVCVFLLA